MNQFNLTSEPWVGCSRMDGSHVQLGLRELFGQAHTLRGLANESPLIDAALLRLCVAILHRCFGPSDGKSWRELYSLKAFDMRRVDEYLAAWRDGFDLFGKERPFFQVANLADQSKTYQNGKKPAREMIAEQSSYGAPRELFESRPEGDSQAISAAIAARWLVALQAFHTGGLLTRDVGNGDPTSVKAAPLCGLAVVTIRGSTLFETLVLNLITYPPLSGQFVTHDGEMDLPAWEQPPLVRFTRRACRGWLDWLTWQSRRIQLFGDGRGGVHQFVLLSGCELVAVELPRDPMCAYRNNRKLNVMLPISFSREKAIWRDCTALFQISEDEEIRPALVVRELNRRPSEDADNLRLQIYGQVPNKASIVLTRTETIPLPRALLDKPELVQVVRDELARAEDVQSALRGSLYLAFQHVLTLGSRTPDSGDTGGLVDNSQALPRFWAAMKVAFDRFVHVLPSNAADAAVAFRSEMAHEAIVAFEQAALNSSSPTRALKGFTLGRSKLLRELSKYGVYPHNPHESSAINWRLNEIR